MWSQLSLWLLLALLLQGALALAIMFYLGFVRVPLIARGEVHLRDIALSRSGWPERAQQVANAVDNQFQVPLLLYVAGFTAFYLGPTLLEVLLAGLFVASRYAHAYIHLTDNHVIRRFVAFTAGVLLLALLWVELLLRVLLSMLGLS